MLVELALLQQIGGVLPEGVMAIPEVLPIKGLPQDLMAEEILGLEMETDPVVVLAEIDPVEIDPVGIISTSAIITISISMQVEIPW
jgi:hypothetical protein